MHGLGISDQFSVLYQNCYEFYHIILITTDVLKFWTEKNNVNCLREISYHYCSTVHILLLPFALQNKLCFFFLFRFLKHLLYTVLKAVPGTLHLVMGWICTHIKFYLYKVLPLKGIDCWKRQFSIQKTYGNIIVQYIKFEKLDPLKARYSPKEKFWTWFDKIALFYFFCLCKIESFLELLCTEGFCTEGLS